MEFARRKTIAWVAQNALKYKEAASIRVKTGSRESNHTFDVTGGERTSFSTSSLALGDFLRERTREGKVAAREEHKCRKFCSRQALESEALKCENSNSEQALKTAILKCDDLQDSLESGATKDEIAKIREEFDAARQSFQNIPAALHLMPKMDPCGIYANDNLRLDHIQVYGFDYDYTVAHYTESLQALIYDLAMEHIVKENRYPESCLQFQYDPDFPIRGLWYDKKHGCLLKLDFFHSIEHDGCYYGRRKMTEEEVEGIYGNRRISRDYASNLTALMDLFCFSEACLLSDIIQHFVDEKLDFDPCSVYEDVKHAIGHVHHSGLVHRKILAKPEKYLVKNAAVLHFLNRLKEKGKKLFLLTNSPFYFVDGGMRFMFEDFGLKGDSWQNLFDVVIALADKPNFYMSERPFRCYDKDRDILAFSKVDKFEPRKIYYHGCLNSFLEITKWKGTEVIYFGDHLFSDLRGPSKAGWRTAAIIRELEREIIIQNEDKYRFQQAKLHILQELLGKFHSNPRGDTDNALLDALEEERQKSRHAMKGMFNPRFGAAFLTDTGKESAFAYNIQRYADVYTSKIDNFLNLSSEAWLYTPYDVKIMPHHVKIPSSVLKTKSKEDS
uniref:Uncharacterized protein n=1 Tax=Araucaria cunninghamii TaxID=56994 RepID=A0A0D6R9B8_ARACU